MAHLAIVGTHSTNGVAAIHSDLLRTRTVPDFADMFPERFNNKTNGVTPRRWLLLANPDLAGLLTDAIGDGWITDLAEAAEARPAGRRRRFPRRVPAAKRAAKCASPTGSRPRTGIVLDPDTIFDTQIKRIHEYKRQLLNVLHVVVLLQPPAHEPGPGRAAADVLLRGQGGPGLPARQAHHQADQQRRRGLNADPDVRGKLQVEFLPNYCVTLAERLIPASDVSEQISTAGYEASGTSNMKFMMNGALTIGTRDGATIEMAEEAGEENFFLFGLTAEQVAELAGLVQPALALRERTGDAQALDLIFSDHFSRGRAGDLRADPGRAARRGDYYMHLADLTSYAAAQRAGRPLRGPRAGPQGDPQRRRSGKFSSDRTIAEYARDIWKANALSRRLTATLLGRRIMAGSRLSRSRGLGWMALGIAVVPVVLPGCSPRIGAARTPPPPVVTVVEARRMTVPVMAEPMDDARVPGSLDPCPRARVPQGDSFPGRRRGQEGPAPSRHRRRALQGQARRRPGGARAGGGRPEESQRLQVAGSRSGPARGGSVDARSPRSRSVANSSSTSGTPRRSRMSSESRRFARGRGAGRSRQGQPRPGQCRLRYGHRRRPGRR